MAISTLEDPSKPLPISMESNDASGADRSAQIFVFGDQTIAFEPILHSLLHIKGQGTLSDFFDRVGSELRNCIGRLPFHQQNWFPFFTTLVDLFAQHDKLYGSPALKFTLLAVTELAQFIRYVGHGSILYPSAARTYLIGACTGSFAAAAISTSQTLAELLPAAVETVIVSFRVGLRALILRDDIGPPLTGEPKSWSAVLGTQDENAVNLVDTFNSTKGLMRVSQLYISSVSLTSVTVSGPPKLLAEFISSTSLKHSFLPIELPYHAPHLLATSEVDELVQPFHTHSLEAYRQRLKIVSLVGGEVIVSQDFHTLLCKAVSDALREQLRWDVIVPVLGRLIADASCTQCQIYQVSSTSGPFIAAALTRESSLNVKVVNLVEEAPETDYQSSRAGKFSSSDIAIIGYSGRFPDASSNEEFWELLMAGRDVHRTIPEDRFDWQKHYDPIGCKKNTSRVKYGCFIKEPGVFDARFFNMSPRECENSDPAQRLAITTAYEAMEMAGLVPNTSPSTRQDRIGVFYGVTSDDWREVNSGQDIDTYFIPGGNRAFIPGRISYFFRFCGPSLSIDTACSSSFAAIQTACVYLWRGECDTAVAGGTNILTNPDNFAGLDRGHFLSTTGNCNAFDDGASGYCRSDAVGSVILKRLEDAVTDNDPIFGVIRGAFTNHCGRTDSITRPFEGDQAAVFNRIMSYTGLSPLDVGYVEMHGTGTQAGDATEMKSVLSVFGPEPQRKHPLYLGTAKANIGHAESASGVASLIKVLLMMKNNAIPPHCGIKTEINRNYPKDLKQRNILIPMQPVPWHSQDVARGKRAVFLNNFSAAGGNTAMLVEDAPSREPKKTKSSDPRGQHLVTVTAKSIKALQGNTEALVSYLENEPDVSLSALSYTTTARRIHHSYRLIISGSDIPSVCGRLQESLLNISEKKPAPTGTKIPKVLFVFTGQGTLYHGIGRSLFDSSPIFRDSIRRLNRLVEQQGFPSFLGLIVGELQGTDEIPPVISHLALVCTQMALYEWWKALGVNPAATIGHSLGEYAALYAAGVLSAAHAVHLVGTRAQLLTQYATRDTHGMLAIKETHAVIERELSGTSCHIACLNQPSSNVVSGPATELSILQEKLKSKGIESVPLEIPYAFHSAQVDSILEPFQRVANRVRYQCPSIPYISPLWAKVVEKSDSDKLEAMYLTNACRQPVNFQGALETARTELWDGEQRIWLEIGPHPTCSSMIKGTLGSGSVTVASLRKNVNPFVVLSSALETLYSNGIDIQWSEYHQGFEKYHETLSLPRYAWDLKKYWIQYRHNFCLTKGDEPAVPIAALVEEEAKQPLYLSPSIQRVLEHESGPEVSTLLAESDIRDPQLSPVLEGHAVNGAFLCPSSLYADIGLTVAKYMMDAVSGSDNMQTCGFDVAEMSVHAPLVSRPDVPSQLYHVSATADWQAQTLAVKIWSVDNRRRKISDHASFVVRITPKQKWVSEWKRNAYLIQSRIRALYESVETGSAHKIKQSLAYHLFATLVDYGTDYQGMQEVALDAEQHEATAKIFFQVDTNGFTFNPCWVDSLGHIAGFIMNASDFTPSKSQVFINHGWDRMRLAVSFAKGREYQVYNRMQLESGTTYTGDTYIFAGDDLVGIFEGVRFQGVPRRLLDRLLPSKPAPPKPEEALSMPIPGRRTLETQSPVAAQLKQSESPKESLPSRNIKQITDNLASRVMAIVAREAGVDLADFLSSNDEFANYGIDSLLSLTICGKIQEELAVGVPSSLFAKCPTPRELIAFFTTANESSMSCSSSESDSGVETPGNSSNTHGTSDLETEPSVLTIIRKTISAETGVTLDELTPMISFADLGIDSLMALTIVGKLTEALDLELPSSIFMENENLEEVTKALGLAAKPTPAPSSLAPNAQFDPHAGPPATSILLWGNPKTSRKILFLFPDGSGSATSYASLPKLGSDTAAYGLNCPWMKTPQDMKCTLEEMTAKYVVEIQRRQPRGPYCLGGWSAGGICAYEAAQQLAASGSRTEKLILIDSPNPIGLENPPQRMYDFFESLGIFGIAGKAPPSWLRPHFDAFIRLLDNYVVRPVSGGYMGSTHMLYARDGICNGPDVPRPELRTDDPREMLWLINNRTDFSGDGWSSLVGRKQLHITVLSGVNHFSMMDPGAHMGEFREFLQQAMA